MEGNRLSPALSTSKIIMPAEVAKGVFKNRRTLITGLFSVENAQV